MKKALFISCTLLAAAMMLGAGIVPHHHHHGMACALAECCSEEAASAPSNERHHDPEHKSKGHRAHDHDHSAPHGQSCVAGADLIVVKNDYRPEFNIPAHEGNDHPDHHLTVDLAAASVLPACDPEAGWLRVSDRHISTSSGDGPVCGLRAPPHHL